MQVKSDSDIANAHADKIGAPCDIIQSEAYRLLRKDA